MHDRFNQVVFSKSRQYNHFDLDSERRSMAKTHEMNLTEGPMLRKLIVYAVPLILSGMLQLLFNTVDVIVVGKFVDEAALAAVGSCGSTINLFLGLFIIKTA